MPSFNSLTALEKYIKNSVKESFKNVGEYVVEETKQEVDEDVYSYKPTQYPRTEKLKNSIVAKEEKNTANSMKISIEHDESLMDFESIVTGEDVSKELPYWIHEGHVPNIFNNNDYPWMHSRPYMENTVKKLEKNKGHVKKLKEELKKYGIDAE